jgi:hypothetical protein
MWHASCPTCRSELHEHGPAWTQLPTAGRPTLRKRPDGCCRVRLCHCLPAAMGAKDAQTWRDGSGGSVTQLWCRCLRTLGQCMQVQCVQLDLAPLHTNVVMDGKRNQQNSHNVKTLYKAASALATSEMRGHAASMRLACCQWHMRQGVECHAQVPMAVITLSPSHSIAGVDAPRPCNGTRHHRGESSATAMMQPHQQQLDLASLCEHACCDACVLTIQHDAR